MARCSLPPAFINTVRSGENVPLPDGHSDPSFARTTAKSVKSVPKENPPAFLEPHPKRQTKLLAKRRFRVGVGVGLMLLLGGLPLVALQLSKPVESSSVVNAPTRSVSAAPVEIAPVKQTIEATGSVAAFELTPVFSQASDLQIQQVLVEEGEWVEAGQLLARLNNDLLQAQVDQAKAAVGQAQARLAELQAGSRSEAVAQAEAIVRESRAKVAQAQLDLERATNQVKRHQMLADQGAIARDRLEEVLTQQGSRQLTLEQAQARLRETQQQLAQQRSGSRPEVVAQAEAALAQAKAEQQAAEVQLQDTQVLAPVSGQIAEKKAKVGDLTSSSASLFSIIKDGRLELLLKIPETQLELIQPGQEVQILAAGDHSSLTGTVREINPMVDAESRLATVNVDLSADNLRSGMFLQAQITTASASGVVVPAKAVLPQPDGSAIVYRLTEDNTVEAQTVEMGDIADERLEIKQGLQPGDRVVVKGVAYLQDGDRVEVVGE